MGVLEELFTQADGGKAGAFVGKLILEWVSDRNWRLLQQADPLSFVRGTGEQILPVSIPTDLGSIPRPFWTLPGMDPQAYAKAYVLHDYMFLMHQKRPDVPVTFDEANLILAEMLLAMHCPRERVVAIYEAVQLGGKAHWDPVLS